MSTFVKVWISIMLAALIGLTGATVWWITREPQARPIGSPGAARDVTSQPVDFSGYTMVERSGQPFEFNDLKGTVWIASMFYSTCPHQCADLNRSIGALASDPLFDDVKFVSVSVDPAVDTAEVLAEYAKAFEADPDDWLFMHGEMSDVTKFGKELGIPAGYKVHVRRLVLVDREGRVRGYYRYNDQIDIAELRRMVQIVLAEEPATTQAL